jgi:hypothetical protein
MWWRPSRVVQPFHWCPPVPSPLCF